MQTTYKVPFITYLFFILVYGNQGFSSLPSQSIYYLTRESWHLSATALGIIAFLTSLAWMIKPVFGFASDYFSAKRKSKLYLISNTILIILTTLYIIFFGLTFVSLILCLFLINFAMAGLDVANDKEMCILEQKYNLHGRIQSVQWIALGAAGLVVAIFGAIIASKFSCQWNYRIAYGFTLLLPLGLLWYIFRHCKENKESKPIKFTWKCLTDKSFLIGALFIILLRFSPSFGMALTIKMRECLGIEKMFIGYLGATGTVLGIVGYLLYYWKGYKVPLKKLLYFAILFSAITNLCYLYIPNKWVILTYNIAFGAFDGICFLAIMSFIARIVPIGYEGVAYAVITSLNNLSGRLGGVCGGIIYDNWGYTANVLIASLSTLACVALVPLLIIKEPKALK